MRRKILVTGVILMLLVATGLLAGCQVDSSEGISTSQQRGIWVSGEGKVTVTPDIANVQLGIEAQSKTVADAQSQATTAMNRVVSALKAGGVADKDIQTSYFSVQIVTRYDPDTQQEVTVGYRVTNLVTVKIRNVTGVGPIIDAVVTAGGNLTRINNIGFTVEDPTPYYTQARDKAMADAKGKATQMAQLADVRLGRPVYITESVSTPVPPFGKISLAPGIAESAVTPISAGELEIKTTVQVVYLIR